MANLLEECQILGKKEEALRVEEPPQMTLETLDIH
jgi:hypothetical protein